MYRYHVVGLIADIPMDYSNPWISDKRHHRTKLTSGWLFTENNVGDGEIDILVDKNQSKTHTETYLVTTFHGIRMCSSLQMVMLNKDGEKKVYQIGTLSRIDAPELDLTMIRLPSKMKSDAYTRADMHIKMPHNDLTFIQTIRLESDIIDIVFIPHNLRITNITHDRCSDYSNYPLLPEIRTNIVDDKFSESYIDAFSGSAVFDVDGGIVGIVTSLHIATSAICITPTIVMMRFINEVLSTSAYNGIKFMPMKYKPCYGEHPDGNTLNLLLCRNNYKNLKKGYLISSMNDNKFDSKGCIKLHGWNLHIDAYIALCVTIKYYHNDDDVLVSQEVEIYSVLDTVKIGEVSNIRWININGNIFVELSKTFLDAMKELGINYYPNIKSDIIRRPYSINHKRRLIALIYSDHPTIQMTINELRRSNKVLLAKYTNNKKKAFHVISDLQSYYEEMGSKIFLGFSGLSVSYSFISNGKGSSLVKIQEEYHVDQRREGRNKVIIRI